MKIGIQTWGSEGHVRPFIALASGLSKANHNVTLAITGAARKNYGNISECLLVSNSAPSTISATMNKLSTQSEKELSKKPAREILAVLHDRSMAEKSRKIGEILKNDDGVTKTVTIIENQFAQHDLTV